MSWPSPAEVGDPQCHLSGSGKKKKSGQMQTSLLAPSPAFPGWCSRNEGQRERQDGHKREAREVSAQVPGAWAEPYRAISRLIHVRADLISPTQFPATDKIEVGIQLDAREDE